jgi:hypothetical protein
VLKVYNPEKCHQDTKTQRTSKRLLLRFTNPVL